MGQPIELIAGLGNPDPELLATRHNAGFWFADALVEKYGARFSSDKKLEADSAQVDIGTHRIRVLKPMTYMNNSGRALGRATTYYKVPPERVLVVYDELDLPPGRSKLKFDGGHAGHNGMRSIIQHLGPKFWRIRIGVGHPGDRSRVTSHVLKRAAADEEQMILDGVRAALDSLPVLLDQGAEAAKQYLHSPKTNN